MIPTRCVVLALLLAPAVRAQAPADSGTYERAVAGMTCKQFEVVYQRLPQTECEYRVGKSLRFIAVGIGQLDGAFTVFQSNIDSDYYLTVPFGDKGAEHDCAIIKPGRSQRARMTDAISDYAFVSPRTGKVFRTWQDCKGR